MPAAPFGTHAPSLARVHDFILGGQLHNALDRAAATQLTGAFPALPRLLHLQRAFLQRVVAHLVRRGTTQFIELGSGLATANHVHHIAHRHDPAARVLYVDHAAATVAMNRELLKDRPNAAVLQADLRDHAAVLRHADLDPRQPVAVLVVGALDLVPDADPAELATAYGAASRHTVHLVLSHLTTDHARASTADQLARLSALLAQHTGATLTPRPFDTLGKLPRHITVEPPGITHPALWPHPRTPTHDLAEALTLCALARVPS